MPIFEYFAKIPESAAVFDAAMTSISTLESKAVVAASDLSGISTLVDVAGGHGLMIKTILEANRSGLAFARTVHQRRGPRHHRSGAERPAPNSGHAPTSGSKR